MGFFFFGICFWAVEVWCFNGESPFRFLLLIIIKKNYVHKKRYVIICLYYFHKKKRYVINTELHMRYFLFLFIALVYFRKDTYTTITNRNFAK